MDRKVVVTKRFSHNSSQVFDYLLVNFSLKVAEEFIIRLEERVGFICNHPTAGRVSQKRKNVRSVLFAPHNQIFYRVKPHVIELLCIFDMRKNPQKRPY